MPKKSTRNPESASRNRDAESRESSVEWQSPGVFVVRYYLVEVKNQIEFTHLKVIDKQFPIKI